VNHKEIHPLHSAAPFEAFEIMLANGTRTLVDHPEFMSFSKDYRTVDTSRVGSGTPRINVKPVMAWDEARNGTRPRERKR
jgi:hypothetical protein